MLAILLCLFYCTGIEAQTYNYTYNDEYGKVIIGIVHQINQYKVSDGAQFSSTDPAVNLTMDCLAANGYGQWTCSKSIGSLASITTDPWIFSPNQIGGFTWGLTSTAHQKGWFLLGNLIGVPSESIDNTLHTPTATHPGCQPPGIVSGGEFNFAGTSYYPGTPKVDANLIGSVRYVWMTDDKTAFYVQGLNDERGTTPLLIGTTTGDQQIGISLVGANPKPPQIITNRIFTYANVSTGGHTVDGSETDYRDEFDMCCDQNYIYITWVSKHTFMSSTFKEVWATAVDIFSGAVITAPFQVASDNTNNFTRPTIACDHRGAPTTPTFCVAFITNLTTASVGSYIGSAGSVETFINKYFDPFTSKPSTTYDTYASATHARVLVSSVAGSSIPVVAVYVRTNYDIILYYPTWPTLPAIDYANYVDGKQANNPAVPNKPFPNPIVQTSYINGIVDEYIVAFANPYDGQSITSRYNQFHCLYRLDVSTPTEKPLVIVRGNDGFCVYHVVGDTRLLLNRNSSIVIDDPTSYCGAVNQMGIHIHWRTSANDHFYVRDTRAFDEPIEEQTLVTNVCVVADGTSHGGTSGAATTGTRKISVWTDPNYGLTSTAGSGLYFASNYYTSLTGLNGLSNIGTIQFSTDIGIGLYLTGLDYDMYNPNGGASILTTAPNCNISFGASGQEIQIGTSCTWNFYGTYRTNCFSNPANGGISLYGQEWGAGFFHYANFNIQPGGQLFGLVPFSSYIGIVNILFGPYIWPLQPSGSSNPDSSALWLVDNSAILSTSKVYSYLTEATFVGGLTACPAPATIMSNVVMELFGAGVGNSAVNTLVSTATDYRNYASTSLMTTSGGGVGVILYNGNPSCGNPDGAPLGPNKVVFNGGNFDRIRFHGVNPSEAGLEITNMKISGLNQWMVAIENPCAQSYQDILISIDTFQNIIPGDGVMCDPDLDYCIHIDGFNNPSAYGSLNVNDNLLDFTGISGLCDGAIWLSNSTGNVEHNIIKGNIFSLAGITMTSDGAITKSYLCNNFIGGLTSGDPAHPEVGILSDHYQGYVKLCQINGCDIGFQSGYNDHPGLFFSSIINCLGDGIQTTDLNTDFDMSGAHGATSSGDDYAAFDTLKANGSGLGTPTQVSLVANSHIEYGNRLQTTWTWTQFGENNTIGLSTAHPLLISAAGTGCALASIERNFWGFVSGTTFIDPGLGGGVSPGHWDVGGIISYSTGITYTATTINTRTVETQDPITVSCSGGYTTSKSKGDRPLSMVNFDTCATLHGWVGIRPQSEMEYLQQYDSLRKYIESCGKNDDSYDAFTALDGAVQFMSNDSNRFLPYRVWLISVLYLNTTQPAYFCACMGSIAGTYQNGKYIHLGYLAVLNWLRHNHSECWSPGDEKMYEQDSTSDVQRGYDPTHLPSLDSLGLGFLLGNTGVTPTTSGLGMQYLASFTSSPNPFVKGTTLEFTLNRMSYVTLAVYDELGRLVWGDGRGSSLEAGIHTVQIDGAKLPSGTLYARISTGFGEVKTVKLVHEK